ncbi:MAG: hypothetical protein KGD68_02335 [Candidatus Lokiarchaeota archaeon]|nr:hypothetical protein [Candidatus Lokiarchaeota archaeon]
MNVRSLMNKQKLLVDDFISVILIIIILFLAIFNHLLIIMSIAVYPLFTLIFYGLYRAYRSIFDKKLNFILRVLNLCLGIVCIIISSYTLNIIFTQPKMTASFIIYLLSMPIFLVGLAGLLKGTIVNVYSPHFRFLNILIGAITVLFTVIAIIFAETGYIFHFFTLLTTLTFNGILRAALYLSEYGLSLKSIKNLKLVWFIMDSLQLYQQEENQIQP